MKRVVLELELGRTAIGDVGQRACHARDLAIGAADCQAAAEHAAPGSVGVAHPVLGFQVRRLPGDVGVDGGAQAQQIIGVAHELAILIVVVREQDPHGPAVKLMP